LKLIRILKSVAVVGLAWILFVGLGDLVVWLLSRIGLAGSLGWGLYAIGLGISAACAAVAVYVARSGRPLTAPAAFVLGGVGAFTAVELCIFAIPDWSPIPLSAALVIGLASGLTVLRAWMRQQPDRSLEVRAG